MAQLSVLKSRGANNRSNLVSSNGTVEQVPQYRLFGLSVLA